MYIFAYDPPDTRVVATSHQYLVSSSFFKLMRTKDGDLFLCNVTRLLQIFNSHTVIVCHFCATYNSKALTLFSPTIPEQQQPSTHLPKQKRFYKNKINLLDQAKNYPEWYKLKELSSFK